MYGDRDLSDSLQYQLIKTNFNMQVKKLIEDGAIIQTGNVFCSA